MSNAAGIMKPYYEDPQTTLFNGDCREVLSSMEAESVHCVVTSPPYWGLRDYGLGDDALGLEPTPELFVQHIVEIFREVKRVLRRDGTLWLNLGDGYARQAGIDANKNPASVNTGQRAVIENNNAITFSRKPPPGLKEKDLIGIPWRVAFALQSDGWWLRSDIIWSKPNPMPESVTDRPTKSHEYLFLLTKSPDYFYDSDAIREPLSPETMPRMMRGVSQGHKNVNGAPGQSPHSFWTPRSHGDGYDAINPNGRNKRSVWTIATAPYKEAHFATFPPKLVEPCVLAGSPKGGTVLDPFAGSSTTLLVANNLGRHAIGIEASAEYCAMSVKRLGQRGMLI